MAGISIQAITNTGLFENAEKAKNEYSEKAAEEKVKLAIMAAMLQSETGALDADKLVTEVTTNYGGQAETTAGEFPVIVTIDGKSFIVDENGRIELAGAKPQITEVKVVTSSDGTGEDVPDNQSAKNTVLYISFKTSLENGTINSVICDNGTVENKNGIYVTKITDNGTYTFTITGTGENGSVTSTIPIKVNKYEKNIVKASDIASMTDKSKIYGATVKGYTCTNNAGVNNWKIFYADENNIYLIADDYIHYDYCPPSATQTIVKKSNYKLSMENVIKDYNTGSASITDTKIQNLNKSYFEYLKTNTQTSTNINMKVVGYMTDTNVWKVFAGEKAEYAIGGPTVEMLMKSYSQKHGVDYQARVRDVIGYEISKDKGANWAIQYSGMLYTNDSLYVIKDTTKANAVWVASPSIGGADHIFYVNSNGGVHRGLYNQNNIGFRPLVCLKSDVQLQKNADGTYTIL